MHVAKRFHRFIVAVTAATKVGEICFKHLEFFSIGAPNIATRFHRFMVAAAAATNVGEISFKHLELWLN